LFDVNNFLEKGEY